MSPRVAYWVNSFESGMEGIASEVACLRQEFPGSIAWGIAARGPGHLSWRRGFSFHRRLHWIFRGATWPAQLAFDINHIFGGLGDWFHLKAVRKHPTILTMAVSNSICEQELLDKIDYFVAEWPGGRAQLQKLGIASDRIGLVFPPVDLERFRPMPAGDKPFTVAFASSPELSDWLEARGVHLILQVAALRPAMKFRLFWRPWGDSLPVVQEWIKSSGLANVELLVGRIADMQSVYNQAHATIVPFTDPARCKPAPNSLVESLACGRPVVVTKETGLADVIEENMAGIVCESNAPALANGLDELRINWDTLSQHARSLSEKHFSRQEFIKAYTQIYKKLT